MRKQNFILSLVLVLLCCLLVSPVAAKGKRSRAVTPPPIPEQCELQVVSAILYDMDRESILFEQNADKRIQPASLTKILSMFVAMDHVMSGHARMNTIVPISANAASTGGSVMGIRQNERISLEQLLFGMAVSSGNDASAAVAEFVGGSEYAFVKMMNVKAAQLGMSNSQFRTPHGLPEVGQYTTARDMLTLARAYLRTYPQNLRFHNTRVLNHNNRVSWNRNPLLGQFEGADGLKTGWVRASGFNLISTARRDGHRLLAVVLGAHNADNRGAETCRLLDAGFQVISGKAMSVSEALENLERADYALDIQRNAHEARALYPTAVEAKPWYPNTGHASVGKKGRKGKLAGKGKPRAKVQKGRQASKQRRTKQSARHSGRGDSNSGG